MCIEDILRDFWYPTTLLHSSAPHQVLSFLKREVMLGHQETQSDVETIVGCACVGFRKACDHDVQIGVKERKGNGF